MSKEKDYIENIEGAERRFFAAPVSVEKRKDGDSDTPSVIEGFAAMYNKRTKIGNWFYEEIMPGAFDDVVGGDVRCLFNHNPNYVLARSVDGNGTLELILDEQGLRYRYTTPKVSYAEDLAENIRLGNVSQSSFAFTTKEVTWVSQENDLDLRQVVKLEILYDVSPVTYPAYADTTVGQRSLESYNEERAKFLNVVDAKEIKSKNEQNNECMNVRKAKLIRYNY